MSYDVEIVFCNRRGQSARILELVRAIVGDDARGVRARWHLRELELVALDEIDGGCGRWTPYYDASLALVVDRWEVLRRYVADRGSIVPFSIEDLLPIDIEWELARHGRVCDYLDTVLASGGWFLSDAWERCSDASIAALLLGVRPDARALIDPIRTLVLEREPRADETTDAYVEAALAASRGRGSWEAVERAYVVWAQAHRGEWLTYDGGVIEWLERMSRIPRRAATLDDVCRELDGERLATLRRMLGNPFAAR